MEPIEGVTFLQGDFREPEVLARLERAVAGRKADVVVSDMAPNLSGIESADAARIAHLVELAVDFAARPPEARRRAGRQGVPRQRLQPAGRSCSRNTFRVVKPLKPKASRDKSSETFLVGIGLKTPTLTGVSRCTGCHPAALWLRVAKIASFHSLKPLEWAATSPTCAHAAPGVRVEQSVVFQNCRLARHRAGAVHRVQAVRHPRRRRRQRDGLLRLPGRSPRQAASRTPSSRKARAAPRSSPSPTTTARSAPPPPTSTAAWSAT